MNNSSRASTMVTRKSAIGVPKQCSFEGCNSDSPTVSFVPFAKPCLRVRNNFMKPIRRHVLSCPSCQTCQKWIDSCWRKNEKNVGLCDVKKTDYVCSSHFVDREPSELYPDPLPIGQVLNIRFQRSKAKKVDDEKEQHNQVVTKTTKTTGRVEKNLKRPYIRKSPLGYENEHPKSAKIKKTDTISNKENKLESPRTDATALVPQNNPEPPQILQEPIIDLTDFVVSTSEAFQKMCDDLSISNILNNNISLLNASKEHITLMTPDGERENILDILIVNKKPDDMSPSLMDTATELERMVKQMETMLSASEVDVFVSKQHKGTQTILSQKSVDQQISRLEVENKKLKIQISSLNHKVSQLENELKTKEATVSNS